MITFGVSKILRWCYSLYYGLGFLWVHAFESPTFESPKFSKVPCYRTDYCYCYGNCRCKRGHLYQYILQPGQSCVMDHEVKCMLPTNSSSQSKHYNSAHQIFGLMTMLAVIVQFCLGFLHHRIYKKTQSTTKMAPIHIWLGRAVIPVGAINAFM